MINITKLQERPWINQDIKRVGWIQSAIDLDDQTIYTMKDGRQMDSMAGWIQVEESDLPFFEQEFKNNNKKPSIVFDGPVSEPSPMLTDSPIINNEPSQVVKVESDQDIIIINKLLDKQVSTSPIFFPFEYEYLLTQDKFDFLVEEFGIEPDKIIEILTDKIDLNVLRTKLIKEMKNVYLGIVKDKEENDSDGEYHP